ncbi:PAS domain S-box protein [Solimonas sp. SE-A11]|uniref:PAS domain S-box protein n=1 Tax=Solimonas sp. SE-A11 TaxID=3054954 RepID=UPI00259CD4A9|nr:PAS domain S-box protein [Solimonas sp. SE-A11]MDM4772702.1 PAS domain S-box protein [Solimonas sp. SE-A11]
MDASPPAPGGSKKRRRAPKAGEGSPAQPQAVRLRAALDSLSVFRALLDAGGGLLCVEPALPGASTPEEGLGQALWDLPCWQLTGMQRQDLRTAVECAVQGETLRRELLLRREGGRPRQVELILCPLRDETDAVVNVAAEVRDLPAGRSPAQSLQRGREDALEGELAAVQRLHAIGRRINEGGSLQDLLEEILATTMAVQGAEFGALQLWDAASSSLRVVAQQGFDTEFQRRYAVVRADTACACGMAVARRERVIVEDVETEPAYAPSLEEARRAGYRAVQATPLISREGRLVGVLSTHFRRPHRPSEHELKLTDLFAAQAALAVERLTAGEALRVAETRLRASMTAGRMASWYWDAASGQTSASETLAELFGLPRGERWRGDDQILRLLHPEDAERHLETLRAAAGGGWHSEFRVIRPVDGEIAWLEEWADATTDPQTGKLGIAGLVWDVSDRKNAELRVQEGDVRFRSLVQSVRDYAILMLDPSGYVIEWTEGAERVKGYQAVDVLGKHFALFFTPEDVADDAPARELAEAAANGRAERYSWRVRKDGSRFWGHEIATAVRGPDGELLGFTKISRDLTESKRAEEALREADRRKDEFLATLAHELRNPLAPIRNGLQILRLVRQGDSRLLNTVDMMDRQLTHLVRLVDDLLDVGRISSGKLQLRRQALELSEVLAGSVEAARALIDAHRHELKMDIAAPDIRLDGDLDRLTQVFSNLLSNAAKYTEPGGHIRLAVWREADTAVISITDDGIGIPSADLEHVFDLFSQVRAHQGRAEGGLGIGLSLVRNLVLLHGGSVSAESAGSGQGSCFTVRLPLLADVAPLELPPALPDEAAALLRVLVVDDNADAANSLAALLELQGHATAVAHDGAEGLLLAQSFRPDVAILDIGMPRMDGVEAARRLRSLPGGDRVLLLALTGLGQATDRERTREAGFDHHLVKPLNLALLAGLLAERAEAAKA